MKVKNTTRGAMCNALDIVNQKYDNNIAFRRIESINKKDTRFLFTLTVYNSRNVGSRISPRTGYRIAAACWHVHGDFFDALLELTPDAEIRSSGRKVINKNGGNWQDRNIGTCSNSANHSECCNCYEVKNENGKTKIKRLF